MILITIIWFQNFRAFVFIKNQRKNRGASTTHVNACVSVGIHLNDMEAVIETYELMSKKFLLTYANFIQHGNSKTSNVFLFLVNDAR